VGPAATTGVGTSARRRVHSATIARLLQNLLLALASVVVFLTAAEGLSRVWYLPERIRYAGIFEYDRDKVYALKPNLTDATFVGKAVHTNVRGYRDRELVLARPAHAFRVVAIGDSITFGHGVDVEDTWPDRLERRLAVRFPSLAVDVINTAVPGNSPFQEYTDLERALDLQPDAAVIQFVLNDVVEPYKVFRRFGGKGIDYHGVDDVPYLDWTLSQRSAFYLFLKDMAARLRFAALTREGVREGAVGQERRLSWQAAADEPGDAAVQEAWRECLDWMQREIDLCRQHDMRVVLLAMPQDFQLLEPSRRYAQRRLAELASRNAIAYVDLLPVLEGRVHAEMEAAPGAGIADARRTVWRRYFLDQDHLTPAGHELVAELLEPRLVAGGVAMLRP
jgi:lysophospholipase L1-like esterase